MLFEDAVIVTTTMATPIFLASQGTGDYDLPGQGGVNEWQQNFEPANWEATASVEFVNGQASLPLRIIDDAENDGSKTIVWEITDNNANYGFTQQTYTFSEDDAHNQNNGRVSIGLSLNSPYKTATITIQDSNSDFNDISGNSNNNNLYGGTDNDSIEAGAGNDLVYGQNGNDRLYGQAGQDTLGGENGDDYLNGGAGNDKLYGQSSNDALLGWIGNDSLYGAGGNDILLGWDGNDYLTGANGNDIIKGQVGNDTLAGGPGNDRLTGAAGADTFVFYSPSEGIDTILLFSKSESDKIQVSASGFGIGQDQYDKFTYNSSTGALFFEQTQLASLQPSLGFVPSSDITIV